MYGSRAVTLLVLISDDVINWILKLDIQTNILVYVTRCCTDLTSKVLKERTFGQSSALLICDQQSLRSVCAYAQSDQSLCLSLEYSMTVKLLTEHHLEFLSLKGGCKGSSESTLIKMSNCWKPHAMAQILFWPNAHITLSQ